MEKIQSYEPLLGGVGLGGYRSFAAYQEFEFPTKVTVLAGTNNSGKSNVLRFLKEILPRLRASGTAPHQRVPSKLSLGELDVPRGFDSATALTVGVPVQLGSLGPRQYPDRNLGNLTSSDLGAIQEVLMTLLSRDQETYWSRFVLDGDEFRPSADRVAYAREQWHHWEDNFNQVLSALGGGMVDAKDVMHRLLQSVGGFSDLPNVVSIAGARRVSSSEDEESDWLSGQGIINELMQLQNPAFNEWEHAQAKWRAINDFVQTVLGDPNARLNVPHDRSTIQVETPDRVLPLSNLGSGVEQVIVLAAAATVTSKSLVCVEEPETNLHPLLQKKLVRYLTDDTDNQYVIATHSSHLLDDSRAGAYHIRLTTNGSVAARSRRPHELIEICHDLGYRPSDLLQANCVVWVEGPSDRIYLRRWLELVDAHIAEGIDYSVMFYGGRLLAHLTASEDALEDFINLRRLNRASAVVIDSDRLSSRARLSATKERIRTEFESSSPAPGFAWVTKCYTVENYLPEDVLAAAVKTAHPGSDYKAVSQWENPLPSGEGSPRFDKIAIAHEASSLLAEQHLNRFDLFKQLTKLRDFVRDANGISIVPSPPDAISLGDV